MNENNPFAGMDGTTTPQELLKKLIDKAVEDNNMKPIGGALGMLQKQIESIATHAGSVINQLEASIGQIMMALDVTKLTNSALIHLLIDKQIVSKEEFEKIYQEKVIDPIEKFIKESAERQKKAIEEEQKRITEFAEMAANKNAILDPNTGEEVDLSVFEKLDEKELNEEKIEPAKKPTE